MHAWGGQCNKNLGNAFVIVWRIGDEETLIEANSASILSRKKTGLRSTKSMESMRDSTDSPNKLYDSRKKWNSSQSFDSSSISSSMRKKGFTTNNTPFSPTGSSVDSHSQVDEDENNTLGAESTVSKSKKNVNIDLRRVPGVDQIADGALIGYLKVIADINRSSAVLKYREDPRLNETDKPKKIHAIEDNGSTNSSPHRPLPPVPNQSSAVKSLFNDEQLPPPPSPVKKQIEEQKKQFKVRMGFGLHAGWAIEGAVGSIYKVDATYLSPHVNMAARLETSSRQYKVPILMSHFFHELLSEIPQKKCRKLDVVTVKGSEVPIGIYTYDCFQEQFFTENSPSAAPLTARALHRLLSASGMNSHGSKKIMAQHRRSRTNSNGDSPSLLGGRPRTPDLIKRSSTPELGGTGSNNGSASKPLRSSTPDLRKVTFQAAGSSRITSTPSPSSQPPAPRVEGSPSLSKSQLLLLEDGTAQIELTQQSLPSPPNITAPTHRTKSGSMDEVEGDSPSLLATSSNNNNNSKKLIHSQAMRDASMPKDGVNLSRSMIASTGSSNNLVKRNSKSDTTNGNDDLTNPPDRPADLPPARPFSSKDPSAPSSFYEPKKALTPPLAPESRLLLSEVHKELLIAPAVKPSKRSSTSSKQSTSSRTSATSNSLSKRSSQSTTGAGRLPLPPLSTQHSPTARLLLGQVHKELRKIQKEVDRRKSDFNSRRSTANHLHHDGDDDEEPIDYGAIDEYLKKLFPDAEGIVVPPLDENIMTMSEVFIKDIDLLQLKAHLNDRFYELFSMGVSEYLRGNWLQAKVFLMDANKLMEECVNHFMQTPLYRKEKMYKSKTSQRGGGEEEKEASGDADSVLQVVKYRRQSARLSIRAEGPAGRSNSLANNSNSNAVTPPVSLPRRFSVTRGKATVKEQEEVIDLEFGDGPSQTLLNYMKGFDFQAPADWKGFRPLTSK